MCCGWGQHPTGAGGERSRKGKRGGSHPMVWTAPALDDTSWLLWLMFVSASLFRDYGSERPYVAVRPLAAFRRGLRSRRPVYLTLNCVAWSYGVDGDAGWEDQVHVGLRALRSLLFTARMGSSVLTV